jgi:hypothetical protein
VKAQFFVNKKKKSMQDLSNSARKSARLPNEKSTNAPSQDWQPQRHKKSNRRLSLSRLNQHHHQRLTTRWRDAILL